MPTKHLALALSLPLIALVAQPAHAQPRRTPVTVAAPAEAPTGNRPANEVRVYIGPASELGASTQVMGRSSTMVTTKTTTGGTTTSTTTASASFTPTNTGNGLGVMYGIDATWWTSDRMGFGGNLFGAYVGSSTSRTVLGLYGQPASAYSTSTSVSGTTTTGTGFSDKTTISSFGTAAPALDVTISGPAAGALGELTTTFTGLGTPLAGIAGAPGTPMSLKQGDTAAAPTAPRTTYNSQGGVNYNFGRTFLLNDLSMHGDYSLLSAPAGGVSFFGGVTMPVGFNHNNLTAKSVGDNGNGDTATQTATTYTGASTTDSYTTKTDWKLNESYTSDTSFLMLGPVFGLNAYYNIGANLRLYSQIGYAPVLGGSASSNTASSYNDQATVTVTHAGAPAGAPADSTTVSNANYAVPAQAVTSMAGSEALGSVGVGFGFNGLNLFAEGTARSYNLASAPAGISGPEVIYGLKLGGAFAF